MNQPISERIEMLTGKLQRKAAGLAIASVDADDLFQHMVICLLEKAEVSPLFAEQTDAYLLQYAVWMGKNKIESERTYTRYVDEDGEIVADEDDGDETSVIELYTADYTTPEDVMAQSEIDCRLMDVVKSMTVDNQKVVKMLYAGYSKTEIAQKLGISKSAVSQRIAVIATHVGAVAAMYSLFK